MEPEREGSNLYPWVLYDPNELNKPCSVQPMPDLKVQRSFKDTSLFHVLIDVKNFFKDEVTLKHDYEYLIIQTERKEKKEEEYECFTSFNNLRRIKIPQGVDITSVDCWTSKDGFLHVLAPIDTSPPKNDGLVNIYFPCLNFKIKHKNAETTFNYIQRVRFENIYKEAEPKKDPPQPAQNNNNYSSGNTNRRDGNMYRRNGNMYPRDGNMYPRDGNVYPRDGNMYPRDGNMYPRDGNMYPRGGNVYPRDGNMYPRNGNMYPRDGNMYPREGNMYPRDGNMYPRDGNMYPGDGNVYFAVDNMYPPNGNMYHQGGNMYPQGGDMYPPGGDMYPPGGDMYPPSGDMYPPTGNMGAPPMTGQGRNTRRGPRPKDGNKGNYEYENGRYPQEANPPDHHVSRSEMTTPEDRFYVVPRNEYIYAAEMDPNTINE